MDTFPEPYAFSDAVFIVRIRDASRPGDDVNIVVEEITSGARRSFSNTRDLAAFFADFGSRAARVA